ncbi:MAG: ATP-binding protein [Aquisalinus sp.]|nr:ATP-binding protein [Aquisalinus sp.]
MKFIQTSIARKLTVMIVGVLLLAVGISTGGSLQRELSGYSNARKTELTGIARVLATSIAVPMATQNRGEAQSVLTTISTMPDVMFVRVRDANGRPFAEMGSAIIMPNQNFTVEEDAGILLLLRSRSMSAEVPIVKAGVQLGTLTVYRDVNAARILLIKILQEATITLLLTTFAGIFAAWLIQKQVSTPVQKLAETMGRVRETGNFDVLAERVSQDEVGDLADAFNDMLVNIRERDDKLATYRRNLEKTVQKRTLQFRKARDEAVSANAAKSEFLATMSHEIRTPMNGIMVMAELLSNADLAARYKRYANVIVNSGQSLLSIINDILDLSKIEAGKMDLETIAWSPMRKVGDVINLFEEKATSNGLEITAYVSPDVPEMVMGDPVRLNQIVSNLVSNAIKFTHEGHVAIEVLREAGTQDMLRFNITDTGIGIPEDKLARVFESFSQADQSTTREYGGTGLGLSICQKLVRLMGGEIGVTSEEGKGSCFWFTIKAEAADIETTLPDLTGRQIQVAMKGQAVQANLVRTLQDYGATVFTQNDAPESTQTLDFIIADAAVIQQLPDTLLPQGRICLAAIGDHAPEQLVQQHKAHDLLFQPILPDDIVTLAERMAAGQLLGLTALEGSASNAPTYTTFSGKRILVADDSAVNREVIIEAMNCLCTEVETVANGQEAVDRFREEKFDLVFMDCSMPVMDGYEATRQIRAYENEIAAMATPVIALTAQMAGAATDAWKDAGMDAFLTKPFTLEGISAMMAQHIEGDAEPQKAIRQDEDHTDPAVVAPAGAPAPATDVTSMLNPDVLAELKQMGEISGRDMVARALTIFNDSAPAALRNVAESLNSGDVSALGKAAHALKSMSYNIGAQALGDACARIEERAAAGEKADAQTMQQLTDSFQATVNETTARLTG